ncbi:MULTISPECIES: type II and III secretion system protein family protein [Paraburkholderia]|uniref:Pilus assembly protein CpaC n=1 Tax=Paraburkholderia terricola TaxID=169427 RepID=A0A1M6MNQ7_9BURK|nr:MULTISPECIES: type II and III secretion system protein family protein [Paraburkholderia]AXE96609.1 fimbrial protein [Paraburkholderia terricola]SDO06513.1 pilus assembly protein CpaC [Paraburkholderia sediminicola]SHJ85087.1 pilus assembly protein CpaC [Paraburkholderia terricola]
MTKQFSPGRIGSKLTACAVISWATALAVHAQAAPARAALPGPDAPLASAPGRSPGTLAIDAGKGTLVRLNENASSVFVADPTIADVHAPSPKAVFVLGKKAGSTTLYVLGADNRTLLQQTVVVSRDTDALRRAVAARFPAMRLQLTAGPGSLLVSGQAASASDADAVVQTLTPYLADKEVLVNRITIDRPLQVQLRVRITEVDRNVTQQLGINWAALGSVVGNFTGGIFGGRQIFNLAQPIVGPSGTSYPINLPSNNAYSIFGQFRTGNANIQVLVDALNQEGLLTVLAEPNLVAMSGQTASFLAGGEFPIPVAQINGAVTVDYKQFGVKLDFTPTVMHERRISLKVRPEVSQIDATASVTTNGITVPGLSVRRADTTVELASGQSFAIGGLLQTNTTDIISQVPGLGSIPILGKLFSSTNYQNNKTELVIIVTPYLVEPTDPAKLRTPLDALMSPSSDIEYSFRRESGDASTPSGQPRLVGAAGYVY